MKYIHFGLVSESMIELVEITRHLFCNVAVGSNSSARSSSVRIEFVAVGHFSAVEHAEHPTPKGSHCLLFSSEGLGAANGRKRS